MVNKLEEKMEVVCEDVLPEFIVVSSLESHRRATPSTLRLVFLFTSWLCFGLVAT